MRRTISGIFLFCITFILNTFSYASEEHTFEYQVNTDLIAFQVYKNAPFPPDRVHTQDFYEKDGFQKVSEKVMIENNKFEARYFGGWVFMDINEENAPGVLSINTTFEKFKNGEQPDVSEFARIAQDLRSKSELANIRNPYAGRSLSASYTTGGGIPAEGQLIPTCTFLENTDRLPKSLMVVYGGTLALKDTMWTFQHEDFKVFSYGNTHMSAYCSRTYLKGNFRYTDDGITANHRIEITNFPSWF